VSMTSSNLKSEVLNGPERGAVAGLVGIKGGVVSGVINLESSDVRTSDWRPRHDKHYHEA
jgi:transposase